MMIPDISSLESKYFIKVDLFIMDYKTPLLYDAKIIILHTVYRVS